MTEAENREKTPLEVVKAVFAAMRTLDYDTALSYVSETCEYENKPMPDARVFGPAGIRAVLEPFFAPTLENEFILMHESASGPVVFIERLDRHRLSQGWIELPVIGIFEVHEGRITLWRDYFDLSTIAPMLAEAGLIPK